MPNSNKNGKQNKNYSTSSTSITKKKFEHKSRIWLSTVKPSTIAIQEDKIYEYAKETFKVLGCAGVSRIDFLIDEEDGSIYVNEINTIPGALSYYLWEATGKSVTEEMEELINIAIKRETDREKLTFSYDQNILAMQGGTKGSKGVKGSK